MNFIEYLCINFIVDHLINLEFNFIINHMLLNFIYFINNTFLMIYFT